MSSTVDYKKAENALNFLKSDLENDNELKAIDLLLARVLDKKSDIYREKIVSEFETYIIIKVNDDKYNLQDTKSTLNYNMNRILNETGYEDQQAEFKRLEDYYKLIHTLEN